MVKVIFWSGILGAAVFAMASVLAGVPIEGYSPISQYISESYANGMPYAIYFQYAFILSGILLILFGFLAPTTLPKSKGVCALFYLIALFYGMGTMVTGIFPCDIGCAPDPVNPSVSQVIHNISGALTYMTVPCCLIGLGVRLKKWPSTKNLAACSLICGMVSLSFVVLLFSNPSGPFIGLFQRITECSILFWIVYCSFFILRKPKNVQV